MSIRFKFRSSVNFDTVEIDGNRESISVRELRAKILRGKTSQQQQQGFDLVFSDAVTGLEYEGDDCHIPPGSSVIVKRVPGGTLPSSAPPFQPMKDLGIPDSINLDLASGPVHEFDDFGADLCPVPDSKEKDDAPGLRLEAQKLESSDLSQAIPKGEEKNLLPKVDEQIKSNKWTSDFLAQNASLPPELKCTLCKTYFEKAVMIPCCQHSFCEKCIQLALTEKGRCPKCLSGKCKVENLLPNVALDRAIKHFLESQMVDADLENDLEKYVPDGESAIQGKEISYGIGVVQRKPELPQSSFATGKGPHQVLVNASYAQHGTSMPLGDSDFQGENQPVILPVNVHDKAGTNTNRKVGYWNGNGGGDVNFLVGGQRKGIRTCYTCGSPDHLMKDCPVSNFNPMFQPGNGAFQGFAGYPPTYWSGSSVPQYRPYPSMYGNPGMMSFNASMVPASSYAVPSYLPAMTNCPPGPGGNMQMGGTGPPRHSQYFRLQPCENRRNDANDNQERKTFTEEEDNYLHYNRHIGTGMSNEYEAPNEKESRLSHSEDSLSRRSGRKRQHDVYRDSDNHHVDERLAKISRMSCAAARDKWPNYSERSNSGKETRSSDRYSDGRHKHHHGESKKYHERPASHYDSDSSFDHRDVRRRVEPDIRASHKRRFPESGLESNSHFERRQSYKEKVRDHDSRHSRHGEKHSRDIYLHDRHRDVSRRDEEAHRNEYR